MDTTTRTTARTTLALLREAGDVLERDTAERTCTWLLTTLANPATFVARTQPTYLLVPELVDTLAAIVATAPPETQQTVARYLVNLPPQDDQLLAQTWANLARAVPEERWDSYTAARFLDASAEHHETLRVAAYEVAGRHNPAARTALLPLVDDGSQHALSAFGDVRDLPADTARGYIDRLVASCAQIRERARQLSRAEGGDRPDDLALLNAWHPTAAQWEPLLDLLADPAVWPQDKHRTLRLLARLTEQIPDDITPRLREVTEQLLTSTEHPVASHFGGRDDTRGAALELAYSLAERTAPTPAAWRRDLLDLLAGDRRDRHWVAYIARHRSEPAGTGLLAALLEDQDPQVRAEATCSLLHRAEHDPGTSSLAEAAIERALTDPGTTVARNVVDALARSTAIAISRRTNVLQRLTGHLSAAARLRASACLEPASSEDDIGPRDS